MFARPFTRFLNDLRRRLGSAAPSSDGQLLRSYVERRDQDAFAALVQRHGALVWGVCSRRLQHEADAEDAFQATFLVLARKAAALTDDDSIAGWLHGVAVRVASQSRRSQARRQRREEALMATQKPAQRADDLRELMDEEIARLPEKYRMPVVLCHLQGHSREEAAQELGLTLLQIKGNLQRGVEMLRRRLGHRGLALAAGALATALTANASARPPDRLLDQTVKVVCEDVASETVLALAKGALSAMFWTKVKVASVVVVAFAALLCGAGLLWHHHAAAVPALDNLPMKKTALASRPAVAQGLSVTVKAAKERFSQHEPLVFEVTFTNVSEQEFRLFDSGYFWDWQFRFGDPERVAKGEPFPYWELVKLFDDDRVFTPAVTLARGQSTTTQVRLEPNQGKFGFLPSERTRPQQPRPTLPPGRYALVLAMKFRDDRVKSETRLWKGTITSNPVEIEIVDLKSAHLKKAQEAAVEFARAQNWAADLVQEAGGPPLGYEEQVNKEGKLQALLYVWFGSGKGGRWLFVKIDPNTGAVLSVDGGDSAK